MYDNEDILQIEEDSMILEEEYTPPHKTNHRQGSKKKKESLDDHDIKDNDEDNDDDFIGNESITYEEEYSIQKKLITRQGYKSLQQKKEDLKQEYNLLIEEEKIARSKGDVSDNAELRTVGNKMHEVQDELRDVIRKISYYSNYIITLSSIKKDYIDFGAHILIQNIKNINDIKEFFFVGFEESDYELQMVNIEYPLFKEIYGKKEGDIFNFDLETFKIIKVEYSDDLIEKKLQEKKIKEKALKDFFSLEF